MDPQIAFTIVFSTLFGLIIGSFLNVVILRRNTGRTLLGRSGCLSCGEQLHTCDLIPFFSYIALQGKCRNCGSHISLQYPLVECGTAVFFGLLAGAGLPILTLLVGFGIIASTMIMIVYDLRHTILPDVYIILFIVGALVFRGMEEHSIFLVIRESLYGAVVVSAPLLLLWGISRGRWLGFGDVKLAGAIGVLLGIAGGLSALWLAYVLGAAIMVSIMAAIQILSHIRPYVGIIRLSRNVSPLTMKSEIAFGPFLILGCMIVWLSTLYGTSFNILSLMGSGL